MSLNDQPISRRAARMLERERDSGVTAASESIPSEPTPAATEDQPRPVVTDAIFAGASWAAPILQTDTVEDAATTADVVAPEPAAIIEPVSVFASVASSEPVEPVEPPRPVRRRDLRDRPADAPPVDLTGEIVIDPAILAGPRPVEVIPEPVAEIAIEPEAVEPTVLEPAAGEPAASEPAAPSVFAAVESGIAPSWAGAAAPTTPPVDAVEDSPAEPSNSRRARRAAAAPDEQAAPDAHVEPEVHAEPEARVQDAPIAPRPSIATGDVTEWSAPDGHWSRQLETSDVDDALESTFSRSVGAAVPTTNALVLPGAPPLDLSGPLTATGEIMLTGSIKLPDAFSRTGAHDQIDLADRDELDDLFDEAPSSDYLADSRPISAAAAVGGEHALGSPMVSTLKPGRGNKQLTGLLIAACALAVVVTVTFIIAVALGVV